MNISSIEKYEKLWNSNFEDKKVKWKSKTTTKRKNKPLQSTGTYNNPSLIDGMDVPVDKNDDKEPVIKKFKTQKEILDYYNNELKIRFKGRGPQLRKSNKNGFYETTIGRMRGLGVYSCDEIFNVRKWSLIQPINIHFTPVMKMLMTNQHYNFG